MKISKDQAADPKTQCYILLDTVLGAKKIWVSKSQKFLRSSENVFATCPKNTNALLQEDMKEPHLLVRL